MSTLSEHVRRALVQRLESFQRAGVTHLPQANLESLSAESSSGTRPVAQEQGTENRRVEEPMPKSPNAGDNRRERQAALDRIAIDVAKCTRCSELASTRTQTVFGVGDPSSRLVFLGEAPGRDEDLQGVPFVGRAGKLLTDIIERGMGLRRDDIYICNILRCRPPGNRNPLPLEAAHCRPWLDATLEVIRPEFLCCLGSIAAQSLLETQETIGRLRGRWFESHGARVMCTYHPAYLLRNPDAKAKTWEDIQMLMRAMGLDIPKRGA